MQELDLGDSATVAASPGLEQFAAAIGAYDPAAGTRLNFFRAFAADGPADRLLNHARLCALQRLLAGAGAPPRGDAPYSQPFLRPAAPLSVHSVMAALRNHFAGTRHDP